MPHKCFISFKTEDIEYKSLIQNILGDFIIDKSLNASIGSSDDDYIMREIREKYLSDSTVTIHLIGEYGAENNRTEKQTYIKQELQASLYNGTGKNTRNGILGVVLPTMYERVYGGEAKCSRCGKNRKNVHINDNTVVKEFSVNYYIDKEDGCCWSEDDRYCVLVRWEDFKKEPEKYIDMAYAKRGDAISKKVTVRPK